MRCRCCNSGNTKYTLGDWYCYECSSSISVTIKEDKDRDLENWFSRDLKYLKVFTPDDDTPDDKEEDSGGD